METVVKVAVATTAMALLVGLLYWKFLAQPEYPPPGYYPPPGGPARPARSLRLALWDIYKQAKSKTNFGTKI